MLRSTKVVEVCASCSEECTIPPGKYYRGLPYHYECEKRVRKGDVSTEVISPIFDRIEHSLQEILDV